MESWIAILWYSGLMLFWIYQITKCWKHRKDPETLFFIIVAGINIVLELWILYRELKYIYTF